MDTGLLSDRLEFMKLISKLFFFYNSKRSESSSSKTKIRILAVFLGIFIITTIVLAALFTREKIVNSIDGIDFIVCMFIEIFVLIFRYMFNSILRQSRSVRIFIRKKKRKYYFS